MARFTCLIAAGIVAALGTPAFADDDSFDLAIQGRQFVPAELTLPAGKKITLTVKNLDAVPAEFESTDLNREKVVTGGSSVTVFIGPLRPGSYEFFDDFSPDTPHGHIVVK